MRKEHVPVGAPPGLVFLGTWSAPSGVQKQQSYRSPVP